MDSDSIEAARTYIREIFAGNAGGHDVSHSLRVYQNALAIAREEPACDPEVVALAALLHDVDDYKLFDTRNNAHARAFLESRQISPEKAEEILSAINSVSFSQNRGRRPETPEGRIVQDADRLDAIGAVGIARTFAYGGEHGRSMEETVAHFHEKLLLLRDEMNTPTARRMAEERHRFMVDYLAELERETGIQAADRN